MQETFATTPEPTKSISAGNSSGELAMGTDVTDSRLRARLRIRSSLNEFLNFLETICLAYQYETADRRIMDQSTIPAVKYFAKMLKPYMDSLRKGHPTLWQPVCDIAELDSIADASVNAFSKTGGKEGLPPPQPE